MARRKIWLFNRVTWGLLAFFILTALWEFKWKPQYRDYYEDGVRLYRSGKYLPAINAFDHAYQIAPNAVEVIIMEGWTNLKLKRLEEARFYFDRAVRIDPRIDEAQLGSSFVSVESGKGSLDPALLEKILRSRKNDANVMILLAAAEEQVGHQFKAAEIYRRLSANDDYGSEARAGLERIYGLSGFEDTPASAFAAYQRPPQIQKRFRAATGSFWEANSSNWSKVYLQGVDLGAAAPGYRPTSLPNDGAMYAAWLKDASQLNANTLRVYTLLPPSFYRAFHHDIESGSKLSLIQQIWVGDPEDENLYRPDFQEETKAEIRYVVDAIHGRGEIPGKRTRGSGIYEFDLADRVAGYVLGSEMDPKVIQHTNLLNGNGRTYEGKYLSVSNATATEAWLAQMADYLFDYEESTYNWQHPVAMLSGPGADPAATAPLEAKIEIKPQCAAGIFAAYPVSPFFPEYIDRNPRYASARDAQGPNPALGIARELRSHLPVPLVVGEYGVSTSMEPRRVFTSTWNQGGYSESQQADALVRLTRSFKSAGVAGALIFELADEWYREGWISEGFQSSPDKASLSLNDLDPAKRYGLIGYHTSKWQLFSGDPQLWDKEKKVVTDASPSKAADSYDGERTLRSLQIAADEGYLYLRLQLECLDCAGTKHTGKAKLDKAAYAIALNTRPGAAGIQSLPFGDASLDRGADFLLVLSAPERSKMLIAESYNPFQAISQPGDPGLKHVVYKPQFSSALLKNGTFQLMPQEQSPGQLLYGDPQSRDYDSRAQWYADVKHSAILARIPWGQLLIADPASLQVFASYKKSEGVRSAGTVGIQATAYVLKTKGAGELKDMAVIESVPSSRDPEPFVWNRWDSVKAEGYRKKAFTAVAQEFAKSDKGRGR